jgi:F0F1-type ATP synthase membrane subunit b/b'
MPKQELHHTLQELRLELEKAHFDYEDKRQTANRSVDALEEKLRHESSMSGDEYLLNELREALEDFEESHPEITTLVSRVADLLAKMGI